MTSPERSLRGCRMRCSLTNVPVADPATINGHRSTALRRVGIAVFSRVVSLITRQRLTDPTSGFRMTDRVGIELFAADYPSDYPEVEAIVLAHTYKLRTHELGQLRRGPIPLPGRRGQLLRRNQDR